MDGQNLILLTSLQNLPYHSYKLKHKIVGLHTFLRNGWTECALQHMFCPSISQKCVRPLNLVQMWLEFEGFRPFFALEPL